MTESTVGYVLNAVIFAFLGIAIFVVTFLILDKLTPYDLWREICENKNLALAVMLGAMSLGLCIIIAAAVH
jgi:putative membrane protein